MGTKKRQPIQASPLFQARIKKLQEEIMKKKGKNISLRDLTEQIAEEKIFRNIEREILKENTMEIKIKFDGRFL